MAAISIYAENRTDNRIIKMKCVTKVLSFTPEEFFRFMVFASLTEKPAIFDAVIEFGFMTLIVDDSKEKLSKIYYSDMDVTIVIDRDTSRA